jgi:anti-repressor protein
MENDLITINEDLSVDAKNIYNKLFEKEENTTPFYKWISRRISEYNFIDGVDFRTILSKSTGGRKATLYIVSLDMAKELCMVEKTSLSKEIRKYFIKCEKILRQKNIIRLAGKEARKSLTDVIQEKGINEKMHGFAYSNFTKLVYKKLGIEFSKEKSFRDNLNSSQLKTIEILEGLAKNYLELGYDYSQIKNVLPEIITKDIK